MRRPRNVDPRDVPPVDSNPEAWWIETTETRFGWEAIAKSNHDRIVGASMDGMGYGPIWRPGERWAHRVALRMLRRALADEAREQRGNVYPVDL